MRSRFSPARCCCGGNTRIVIHGVRAVVVDHGSVSVYRSDGSLLGAYDLSTDLTGSGGSRYLAVPLPASSLANCRVVIELPRCNTLDTGYSVTLAVDGYRRFKITSLNTGGSSYDAIIDVAEGYGAISNVTYPQVATLSLADSLLGGAVLTHSDSTGVPGYGTPTCWTGAIDKDLYVNDGGVWVLKPGEINYAVIPTGNSAGDVEKLKATTWAKLKPGETGSPTVYPWYPALSVASTTVWSPGAGGGAAVAAGGNQWHPWGAKRGPAIVDSVPVTLSVSE